MRMCRLSPECAAYKINVPSGSCLSRSRPSATSCVFLIVTLNDANLLALLAPTQHERPPHGCRRAPKGHYLDGDPPPLVRASPNSTPALRPTASHASSPAPTVLLRSPSTHLGSVLEILCARLDVFQRCLWTPPSFVRYLLLLYVHKLTNVKNGPLRTTVGDITLLTFERYRICELFAELLHCSNMALLNRPQSSATFMTLRAACGVGCRPSRSWHA